MTNKKNIRPQVTRYTNQILTIFLLYALTSCTGEDYYYKDFIKDADKIYPGKMDSLTIKTGFKRVVISGKLSSDPKVREVIVYWNGKRDSSLFPVTIQDIVQFKDIEVQGISEGHHSFTVQTRDTHQVLSVPVQVSGFVYGDAYQQRLRNRAILETGRDENQRAFIKWANINDLTLVGTQVSYEQQNGTRTTQLIKQQEIRSLLPDYKTNSEIQIASLYRPAQHVIDTVYTDVTIIRIP